MIEFRKYASARLQTRCYWRVLVISTALVALDASARQAMAVPRHFPPQNGVPNSDSPSNSGTIRSSASNEPWPDSILQQPHLPAIPQDLCPLYEKGNVQYVFYDPARYRRRFAAETQFSLDYVAKSTFRWRLVRQADGSRQLVVRPRFRRPVLDLKHRILLPITLADESFYESKLVQHEFDHVRISSDERFHELFGQWLTKEMAVIQVSVPADANASDFSALAEKAVSEGSERLFQKMLDLIRVRYAELDQVTRHGSQPLPDDFFKPGNVE